MARLNRRVRTDGVRKRNKYVGFYLFQADYERLKAYVDGCGVSMSQFCEETILQVLKKADKKKVL